MIMKRIVGILFLVFLILPPLVLPSSEDTPHYTFTLAWEGPPHTSSNTFFRDINGDGLLEILYSNRDEDGTLTFTALDTFGTKLWSVPLEKSLMWVLVKDINDDGLDEIFLTTRMTSRSEESESGRGVRRIWCFNAEGILLWTLDMEVDPVWDGTWSERFSSVAFLDEDGDGCDEIVHGNLLLDSDGTILKEYGQDCFVIGDIGGDADAGPRLIFSKEKVMFSDGEYTFCCRVYSLTGALLWQKEVLEPIRPVFLTVEGTERFFLVQADKLTEVNLDTFEETAVPLDLGEMHFLALPKLESTDVDGNSDPEYVITATNIGNFGRGTVCVYDGTFNVLWSHTGPTFSCEVEDLDGDGTCEFCLIYYLDFVSCGPSPSFFQVLNHDGSERWRILFDDSYYSPDFVDIDADGETEIIFEMNLEPKVCYEDESLEEIVKRLQELMENPPSREKSPRHLYIFGSEGEIEKQIRFPSIGYWDFEDLDGDGDRDIFYHVKGEGIYVYTNTRFPGPLDRISGGEPIEEVDLGDTGFRRDNLPAISLYYEYQKVKEFFDVPILTPLHYRRKMTIVLSIPLVLALGFCYLLVRIMKKEETDWESPWRFKRFLVYMLLLLIPPVGLVYFVLKVALSDEKYRKALGFIRISVKQLAVSGAVGVILLLINWGAAYLIAINNVNVPSTGTQELIRKSLATAVLFIVITAPFVEEILFSGYLYPILRKKMGTRLGIALTAVIFAFLHLRMVMIPLYFVHAAIKTYAYERTHCIYVPMIIHFVNNVLVVIGVSLLL
jgi:membrane protease YdiL (CAAX protease family)